jgi:maleylacetate reductase
MTISFDYTALPARILFGCGAIDRVAAELRRLSCSRPLILSTPRQGDAVRTRLEAELREAAPVFFPGGVMHTPVEVTAQALRVAVDAGADCLIALGGGSAIGLGKAIALQTNLPQIAIPTTYAGSEVTPILGETRDGSKQTQVNPKVLPEVVIYDPNLTLDLPIATSVSSGFNAIAHAVEALYARDRNPITTRMAIEGIAALTQALPALFADPFDVEARSSALYGAWLCGTCLGTVGMSLHHKLCHTLGGAFNLPHAEMHAILLPHALAYNAPAAPEAIAQLQPILGDEPAQRLHLLAGSLGIPRGLRELGMPESGIDAAARQATTNAYWNPRALEIDALRDMLARAWAGAPPAG